MNENQNKYYTDLDMDLQQLAAVDWPAFVTLLGTDAVLAAKVCLLKNRGKSQQQISMKLNISLRKSQVNCEKCELPS